jgi:hypothetical protein
MPFKAFKHIYHIYRSAHSKIVPEKNLMIKDAGRNDLGYKGTYLVPMQILKKSNAQNSWNQLHPALHVKLQIIIGQMLLGNSANRHWSLTERVNIKAMSSREMKL